MSENNLNIKKLIQDGFDSITILKNANKTLLACAVALERGELEEGALDVIIELLDTRLCDLEKNLRYYLDDAQ